MTKQECKVITNAIDDLNRIMREIESLKDEFECSDASVDEQAEIRERCQSMAEAVDKMYDAAASLEDAIGGII